MQTFSGDAMQTALRQLASDFLSAIVFLIAYGLSDDIYLATALAIAVGIAQFAAAKVRGRPIDAMQWLALGLVLVLGAATLITHDSRFIMVKPTIVHWAIGAIMLRRGWMIRYLPPIARDNLPERVMVSAGYAWAALMIVLGVLNLIIATAFDFRVWAWFISFGAVGAKVVAVLAQYAVFRAIVRRKLRAARDPGASQDQAAAGSWDAAHPR
jgi:intracellular septation protein